MSANKRELRAYLRAERTSLSTQAQHQHAQALAQGFLQSPALLKHRHIAFYLPQDGEIDPRPLMQQLLARQYCLYLPVLHPVSYHQLWFVRYHAHMPLVANRFGILEPQLTAYGHRASNRLPAWALGLIALPLVGFDAQGGRLGMGGGFYDRSLAFTRRPKGKKPLLLGLAHECQKLDVLPVAPWDIPLQGVLTEAHLYWHTETEKAS